MVELQGINFLESTIFFSGAFMKKIVITGILLFGLIGIIIFSTTIKSKQTTQTNTAVTPSINSTANTQYSLVDVASHNKTSDCWLVINNTVYDVTTYIPEHPSNDIISWCGKEATSAYNTKGNRQEPHSARAEQLLIQYKIGELK
jgi:cytochrome b involved in lipid metabolism